MIDGLVDALSFPGSQFGQCHERSGCSFHVQLTEIMLAGPHGFRQSQVNSQRMSFAFHSNKFVACAAESNSERRGNLSDRHTCERCFLLICHEDQLLRRDFADVIDFHKTRFFLQPIRNDRGRNEQVLIAVIRLAVDLGDDRCQHRRPRR